jgi:hypothetical protein
MFETASGSVGGGLPIKSVLYCGVSQLGTINLNGMFRVTPYLEAFRTSKTVCKPGRSGKWPSEPL